MRKKINGILITMMISIIGYGQDIKNDFIPVNQDLRLIKLTDNVYIHESFIVSEELGRFGSNGMILVSKGKAFLFDTPMSDSLTQKLLDFIEETLKLEIQGFITNDWHGDSMEGLELVSERGITSYAHEMTRKITQDKNLPVPQIGFEDSMKIQFEDYEIICAYYGAAHTLDNIVVWIPKEKILFADCMVKDLTSWNLGYTGDGDLEAYPITLRKVRDLYSKAKYVIPGHGKHGGVELIDHTIRLAEK